MKHQTTRVTCEGYTPDGKICWEALDTPLDMDPEAWISDLGWSAIEGHDFCWRKHLADEGERPVWR